MHSFFTQTSDSAVHHQGGFFHFLITQPLLSTARMPSFISSYLYPCCTPPGCLLSFPHTSIPAVHHQGAFFHSPIPLSLMYTTRVPSFILPYLYLCCIPPGCLLSFPHTSVSAVHHQGAFFHSSIDTPLKESQTDHYALRIYGNIRPRLRQTTLTASTEDL